MQVTAYRLRILVPPKDSLLDALRDSRLTLKEGDVVAISSKVISIDEGNCVLMATARKEELMKQESDSYLSTPKSPYRKLFTIARGLLVGSAGIDESNGDGHFILYPKDPMASARRLRTWLCRTYRVKQLGVIITDSSSVPLRRGTIGFALGWAGFAPLKDYRGETDLFGRSFVFEVANMADMLASAAVAAMGEGSERTPVAVIRDARVSFTTRAAKEDLVVTPDDDLFAPLLQPAKWKKR